jgi:hypothetical protein
MTVLEAVGDIIGVPVAAASGVPLSFRYWRQWTFISFEDDGSTILTFSQHPTAADGTADTGSEASLAVVTRAFKSPGVGGAATEVTQAAGATFDLADDTVNDQVAISVRADQLSDGHEYIECTVDGGILIAVPSSPRHKLPADSIPSPLVHP